MKTILLVKNDPSARNALSELLRRCRYTVIAPCDGISAIAEIASGSRIDLVITDHQLNGTGDLAVLKALRQRRPDVPAIILTERGALSSYLKAISLGVTAYLEDPVRARELIRIVADAFGDSAGEEKGRVSEHTRCEAGTQAGRTIYDRGYAELIQR